MSHETVGCEFDILALHPLKAPSAVRWGSRQGRCDQEWRPKGLLGAIREFEFDLAFTQALWLC